MADFSEAAKAPGGEEAREASTLPWIPTQGETPSSGDVMLAIGMTMLAVALLVLDNQRARETLRRWLLVRHRFIRAAFFETF